MAEHPFFFTSGGGQVFGVLHEGPDRAAGVGYVLCAPFAEEALWSQRVFVSLARELSAMGSPVLRFDYRGTGDSSGDFEDSTLESRLADIEAAIAVLRERCGVREVGLLGLGLGATLAAQSAERVAAVRSLVLWQPVLSGAASAKDILRANVTTQMAIYKEVRHKSEDLVRLLKGGATVNYDGYELSNALYEEIARVNLLAGPRGFAGRVLLVHIPRQPGPPPGPLLELQALYSRCDLSVACEQPFWKEIRAYYERADNLFRTTLEWLGRE